MNTILIFPPVWECGSPYPSLAVLSAFLKMNNIKVDVMDLNIEVQHLLFSDFSYMDKQVERLQEKSMISSDKAFIENADFCIWLYTQIKQRLKTDIITSIKDSKDEFEETKYKFICNYMRLIYSANYYPSSFSDLSYTYLFPIKSLTDTFSAVRDIEHNIFYEILKEKFLDRILKYDVIGISVASFNQLVPGLTLAGLIKEICPNKKVIMGGAIVPYIERGLYYNTEIFSYVDYIITGEGESALLNCIRYINGEKNVNLSNTYYFDKNYNRVYRSEKNTIEKMDILPCPDYSEYPLEKYFCRKLLISYVSSRGCFWNKCSFCSLTCSYGNKYRERPLELVIEDLKNLKKEYNFDRLSFNDEALTAKRIKEIAEAKIDNKIEFKWSCLGRLNNYYKEEDLKLAKDSGLCMMSLGLESGSQHVLNGMRKGILIEEVPNILKVIHEAGIWTNIYFIIGFPNESEEDYNDSIKFLAENEKNIDSLCYTYFRLEDNSFIFKNPDKFNIRILDYEPDCFGPSYEFESDLLSKEDLKKRYYKLAQLLKNKKCNTYNIYFDFDGIFSFIAENRRADLDKFVQKNVQYNDYLNSLANSDYTNYIFEFNQDYIIYAGKNIICGLNIEKYEMYSFNKTTWEYLQIIRKYKKYERICIALKQKFMNIEEMIIECDLNNLLLYLIDIGVLIAKKQ